jgi:predicted RNase H-like HicB family nuclease
MKADGYIIVTLFFYKEGNRWVGICKELGTSTFGRSIQEAHNRLNEAVELHLNTLEEVGERERFFREHNITLYSHKPKEKKVCLPVKDNAFVRPYIYPIYEALLNS